MAEETKFSEDELKSLKDLQNSYQQKQLQFGQVRVQRLLVQQQLDAIDDAEVKIESDYSEVQETERKLVEELNKKYGPGSLDPTTGVFTPTETTEKPEKPEKA